MNQKKARKCVKCGSLGLLGLGFDPKFVAGEKTEEDYLKYECKCGHVWYDDTVENNEKKTTNLQTS